MRLGTRSTTCSLTSPCDAILRSFCYRGTGMGELLGQQKKRAAGAWRVKMLGRGRRVESSPEILRRRAMLASVRVRVSVGRKPSRSCRRWPGRYLIRQPPDTLWKEGQCSPALYGLYGHPLVTSPLPPLPNHLLTSTAPLSPLLPPFLLGLRRCSGLGLLNHSRIASVAALSCIEPRTVSL